jgi:hypothetical protein
MKRIFYNITGKQNVLYWRKKIIIMANQNFANHARFVKGYHFVLAVLLLIGTIASFINVGMQIYGHYDILSSILIALLFVCAMFIFLFMRQFPIKAQDRAIRAEENLRHFILTHKALDSRLTIPQVAALRFAPDDEFVVLADRAAKDNLSPMEIKKEIRNWKPDTHRV